MESQKSVKFRRNFNGKVNSFHDFALKFPLLSLIWDSLEVPDSNKNFNIFEKILRRRKQNWHTSVECKLYFYYKNIQIFKGIKDFGVHFILDHKNTK